MYKTHPTDHQSLSRTTLVALGSPIASRVLSRGYRARCELPDELLKGLEARSLPYPLTLLSLQCALVKPTSTCKPGWLLRLARRCASPSSAGPSRQSFPQVSALVDQWCSFACERDQQFPGQILIRTDKRITDHTNRRTSMVVDHLTEPPEPLKVPPASLTSQVPARCL